MSTATVPTFDPLDPLALDAQLDDEERLIRSTVRQYVREKFLPVVAKHFEEGSLPDGIGRDLGGDVLGGAMDRLDGAEGALFVSGLRLSSHSSPPGRRSPRP